MIKSEFDVRDAWKMINPFIWEKAVVKQEDKI